MKKRIKSFQSGTIILFLLYLGIKRLSCSFAFNGNSAFCFLDIVQPQNCFSLSSLALELWQGFALRSSRLFLSQQKKEAFRLLFKSGREETRTLTPKALDPKSSASTNFATRPKAFVCEHLLIYQEQKHLSKGIFFPYC